MKSLLIFAILFFSSVAQAVNLSWDECLKNTAQGNTALESAKKDWLATQTTERVAFAGYLPRLSAATSYTKSGSAAGGGGAVLQNGILIGAGASAQINNNYLASLNFSQNIFNGLEDQSKIDQAEWRTKHSFWNYASVKSNVSFSLKEAFANLVFAQESLTLYQKIFDRRESNYKLVSVRYDNGRENKGSVLLAEAYFEQARLDIIRTRDSVGVARKRLASLMNRDDLEEINVHGEVPMVSLDVEPGQIEKLTLETPAYNQAQALEKVAEEDIFIARSNFLPSLDLLGNVIRQGQSYFPERERWSVAVTLTIPLFDGLRDLGAYQGVTYVKYAAEARKRSTMLDLLPRLKEALNQARQSDLKYSIDGKFQMAASTRAEIARAKYNNGLLSFEDWDIIENELIQRQTTYLLSKRDRIVKYATWENLLGRGDIQ